MTTDFPRKIAICVCVVGAVGFLHPFWLHLIPARILSRIELPNTLEAVRLTAPDGRVYIASEPFGRVQRYGPAGFERGFDVDSRGGVFDAGISPGGNILICSVRARGLITYDPDGREIEPRLPCMYDVANHGRMPHTAYYTSKSKVPGIATNWFSLMAVPLWHPLLAWLMAAAGLLYLKFHPRSRSETS